MERELHDLRGQLTRSISAGSEMEELRRGIDRSERQRAQLSDHIEVTYLIIGQIIIPPLSNIHLSICLFFHFS